MNTETTIIEINGIKMEVDLRHAKMVHDNLRVGTKVKLLAKSDYSGPEVYPGIIVGFEPFESLPTIIVAYVKGSYGESSFIHFAYINASESARKKWELVPSVDDELPVSKENVLGGIDREIKKHEREIEELNAKRTYFLRNFGAYFGAPVSAEA